MTTISRRRFLATAAFSVAATRLRAQSAAGIQVTLTIPAEATGPHMPADFVGLSYEVQQLTDPTFFSANNTGLIQEFKALAPRGVLRLGGNASEFAYWKPTPGSPEPGHPPIREVEGEPKAQYYAVTSEAVRNLAGFLKATGWTCFYGIGMGTNTPDRAAEEAGFAAKTSVPACSTSRSETRWTCSAVIILNKDLEKDLILSLDFGTGRTGAVETEILQAPALDSREAHIARSAQAGPLKQGKVTVTVVHATGLRLSLS